MTDDRDVTSILVWNGRVSRTRPTPTQGGLRPPVQGGENEHDEGDREDCRGEVVKRRRGGGDDEKPTVPGQCPPSTRSVTPDFTGPID